MNIFRENPTAIMLVHKIQGSPELKAFIQSKLTVDRGALKYYGIF